MTTLSIFIGSSLFNNIEIIPNKFRLGKKVEATKVYTENGKQPMSVKEYVKGKDVYIECVISDFTFSKRAENNKNKQGSGFLKLYLNGKKIDDIYTAAFILKGLPIGKHMIKLELVHNDGTPYGIEHNFDVVIS